MKMMKLSVIIPIYNVENFIEECLDSIISQCFDEMEVIAVDDGSTDNSGAIADKYSLKYPYIKVFHIKNRGYANACNIGLNEARGEYVSIIEPDDFVGENMFGELYERAKKDDADIVKSRYFEFLYLPKVKREKICGADINVEGTFTLNQHPELLRFHPSIWSCIYKKSFLSDNNIFFAESVYRGWEDNLFQIKTLYFAKKISYVNKAYYHWRMTFLYQCEKIKNIKMPIAVINESHDWLDSVSCKNPNIFANLAVREMVYFKFVFRMARVKQIGFLTDTVSAYFHRFPEAGFAKIKDFKLLYKIKILRYAPFLFLVFEKTKFCLGKLLKKITLRIK